MSLADTYFKTVHDQLDAIARSQRPIIAQVAEHVSACLLENRWWYLFGTGHSHMLAEELFYRAGGLPCIRPILCPDLMLHESAVTSTMKERQLERAASILKAYPMQADDLLLIASNSGRNAVPVELAKQALERGVRVVALVNRRHSEQYPSRHPSGKTLADLAEMVLDNGGVPGDACVSLPETDIRIGGASTITGVMLLQMIACEAVEKAMASGWKPEVFQSANAGREEANAQILARLRRAEVRHL